VNIQMSAQAIHQFRGEIHIVDWCRFMPRSKNNCSAGGMPGANCIPDTHQWLLSGPQVKATSAIKPDANKGFQRLFANATGCEGNFADTALHRSKHFVGTSAPKRVGVATATESFGQQKNCCVKAFLAYARAQRAG
jgi:hypothetical protein